MLNKIYKISLVIIIAFVSLSLLEVIILRFVPVRRTPIMYIRYVEALVLGKEYSIKQKWVPLEKSSVNFTNVLLEREDSTFYTHHGFNFDEIKRNYKENKRVGYLAGGGSTISQQTAKNVFCTFSRTYTRKAYEAYFTVLIELIWGKDRIFEVYKNIIELGDGVYGIESAAEYHFNTTAEELTEEQALALLYIMRDPLYRKIQIE